MDAEYLLVPDPQVAGLPTGPSPERFRELAQARWPGIRCPDPVPTVAATAWLPDAVGDLVFDLHPDRRSLTICSSAPEMVGAVAVWWARVSGVPTAMWLFDVSGVGYSVVTPDADPAGLL